LNLKNGDTKKLFEATVKEPSFGESFRGAWIFRNSDMKFEDVLGSPPFNSVKEEIQKIINRYYVTAFNKAFDFGFLESRGVFVRNELPDIMEKAKSACRIPRFNGEYKYPNVEEAWNFFFPDIYYKEKHRALDDAKHEAKILFMMYKRGEYRINYL